MSEAFGAPMPLAELNTGAADNEPWVDASGTFIAFASNRGGGAGGSDIYFARRASTAVPFDPPVPAMGVNTSADETDPWISPDGRTLFFARGGDIYTASR